MMAELSIDVYSHGINVHCHNTRSSNIVSEFCGRLTQYEGFWDHAAQKRVYRPKAVFATINDDKTRFGFLLDDLGSLELHLARFNISGEQIRYTVHKPTAGKAVGIPLGKGVKPRDAEQESVMRFLKHESRNRILNLRTGGGKTACGLMAISHYGRRAALVMAAGHIQTWLNSIEWVYDVDMANDVCVVQGTEALESIVRQSLSGDNHYKLIFISIDTLRSFIDKYLTIGYTIDGVKPHNLYDVMDVGVRLVDEAHEQIHALIRSTIFSHINKTIYLSATLVSDDAKVNQQYDKIFPKPDRFIGKDNDHVIAYCYRYNLSAPKLIRCNTAHGYSHVKFEQSIGKVRWLKEKYVNMIIDIVENDFFNDSYEKGQKLLIFCSTTDLCEKLAKALKSKLSNDLSISAYTSAHDVSVLYSQDIVISTPQSAGTGKDIPNLKMCISTVAIGSVQRNLQMLGRLRPLKDWPDVSPVYIWLSANQIRQHKSYDYKKKEQFRGKIQDLHFIDTNYRI